MATPKKNQINLLPQNEFESTTVGRILTWTLSTFRIIVIVTEMVVMLAFLSRFWLDAKNSDLDDLIRQKQSVISAAKNFEKEFKLTQKKLSIFSALASADQPTAQVLEGVAKTMPPDVILKNVSLVNNEIRLSGVSLSETSIAQFIVNLNAQGKFGDVTLTHADAGQQNENTIDFGLSMKVNP